MKLNGFGPFAEAVREELDALRIDQRVSVADMRTELARGLLELERLTALARDAVARITNGQDGRDGAPGAAGQDGRDGGPGPAGERGARGETGHQGERGERGEPGARGEKGEQGPQGPPGVFKPPRKFEAGVIFYGGELAYHEGSTFAALRDTVQPPPHADWQPVAYRGRDGYGGQARGLYDAAATYRAMDVVSFNGSEWRAVRDDPGPLPGDDWVLGAKGAKGKPGEKGDRGEPGRNGEPGAAAPAVEQMLIGADFSLVLVLSDGNAVSCDLLPLLERYRAASE